MHKCCGAYESLTRKRQTTLDQKKYYFVICTWISQTIEKHASVQLAAEGVHRKDGNRSYSSLVDLVAFVRLFSVSIYLATDKELCRFEQL